jgi:hypothetical protein
MPTAQNPNGTDDPVSEPGLRFEDPSDRTNKDAIEGLFMYEILRANWQDANGNPIPTGSVDEAWAIAVTVIENLLKRAATKEGFLNHLAAFAAARILRAPKRLQLTRAEVLADRSRYSCSWELRLGDITGHYSMQETVMHDKWKRPEKDEGSTTVDAEPPSSGEAATAEYWQQKYKNVLSLVKEREDELDDIKNKMMESLHSRKL